MYVTFTQLKEATKKKLDCTVFKQFTDQQIARNSTDELQLEFDRKIIGIEKRINDFFEKIFT